MEQDGADISTSAANPRAPAPIPFPPPIRYAASLPVLEKLRGRLKIPISIDTSNSEVAEAAAQRRRRNYQ